MNSLFEEEEFSIIGKSSINLFRNSRLWIDLYQSSLSAIRFAIFYEIQMLLTLTVGDSESW